MTCEKARFSDFPSASSIAASIPAFVSSIDATPRARQDLDTLFREGFFHERADFGVFDWQDAVELFYHSNFYTQVVIKARELYPDRA